ncbi:hypothetical protein ACS0TY_031492 [Phlomoides rotata]
MGGNPFFIAFLFSFVLSLLLVIFLRRSEDAKIPRKGVAWCKVSSSSDRPSAPNCPFCFLVGLRNPRRPPPLRRGPASAPPRTTPDSFRRSLHKGGFSNNRVSKIASCGSSTRLNMRPSAMKNSLVRIGTVEGDLVKRALATLIRPSSHNQRRRGKFPPRSEKKLRNRFRN